MSRRIINYINSDLITIYQKTAEHKQLQSILQRCLPSHLQQQVTIAQYQAGNLQISIDNSALATELRYLLPELRTQLRQHKDFCGLSQIKILVAPS